LNRTGILGRGAFPNKFFDDATINIYDSNIDLEVTAMKPFRFRFSTLMFALAAIILPYGFIQLTTDSDFMIEGTWNSLTEMYVDQVFQANALFFVVPALALIALGVFLKTKENAIQD
jgi:hypothetical protein